jgi:Queuosine salvage protein
VRIYDEVRAHCAAIAAGAQSVRIVEDAPVEPGGRAGLDPELHLLDAPPEEVVRYVLILDAINFGSGWFEELGTDTDALTAALTAHGVHEPIDVPSVFGLPPGHELTRLYEEALRQLDAWGKDPLAFDTADELSRSLAQLPFYADAGFYKRAQITANDLVLAGVVDYPDIDRLTIFADNLVPHVLRAEGMLEYEPQLAARIDAGEELAQGSREEVEIRACAVHACELLAARFEVAPRVLDNWLWNRGQSIGGRPHRTRTTFY